MEYRLATWMDPMCHQAAENPLGRVRREDGHAAHAQLTHRPMIAGGVPYFGQALNIQCFTPLKKLTLHPPSTSQQLSLRVHVVDTLALNTYIGTTLWPKYIRHGHTDP